MSRYLNFNKIKKQVFTVTLRDEDKTTLLITMPSKKIFDKLVDMQKVENEEEVDSDALDIMYETCATAMSKNRANIKVTQEMLEGLFDFEDLMIFIKEYTAFVNEVVSQKN